MTLLSFMAAEFIFAMRVESYAVAGFKDSARAQGLALAGISMGIAEIADKSGIVGLDSKGNVSFIKPVDGALKAVEAKREFELGEGRFSYSIEDERSKLNINTASEQELAVFFRSAGLDEAARSIVIDSIMDWKDANHEFHLNGAEDEYYMSLPEPYEAKDGNFDLVEELLLVRGVTPEFFYGSGSSEPGAAQGKGGIRDFLTAKGDGKINMNTAPEAVLEAVLGKGRAAEAVLKRMTEGFAAEPEYGCAIDSNLFLIRSVGEAGGARAEIKAIAEYDPKSTSVRVIYWKHEGNAE